MALSAMFVRDGADWLVASVKETLPADADAAELSDLEFLIGDWEAKRGDRDMSISYAWGDGKAFLRTRDTVREKGKVTASGTEIFAKDPATGSLRAWMFDKSGTIAESDWGFDGAAWVLTATGTLPLGAEMSATNILAPLGPDALTWQSIDRSIAGQPVPDLVPLEITRLKK